MHEIIQSGLSETRNSPLRAKTSAFTSGVARFICDKTPSLNANRIGLIGNGLVTIGAIRQSLPLIIAGTLMDGIDGPVARETDQRNPGSVDFKKGELFDTLSDRYQEAFLANKRIVRAHQRGDKFGRFVGFLDAITNPLPSITRAFSETRGKVVPESGKGILGLIGTRPGRAALGAIATVLPKYQTGIDILLTVANLKTTSDRLRVAFSKSEKLLPEQKRKDARVRLTALGLFGIITTGVSVLNYFVLNKEKQPKIKEENEYLKIISQVERYCLENNLDHRIVGGTITDLIGPKTEFVVDFENKTVHLINPNKPTGTRNDGTPKDIDIVMLTSDREKFLKAQKKFNRWQLEAEKVVRDFPNISAEAARHQDWPKRDEIKQFVTAFEFDENGEPYLTFGAIKQNIKPESLEAWKIDVNGTKITTFNPRAFALCYELRVPGGKKKDRLPIPAYSTNGQKLSKKDMADKLAQAVLDNPKDLFIEWNNYINTLNNNPDPLTLAKTILIKSFWDTVGTSVSHGVGPLQNFSRLSNRFTG